MKKLSILLTAAFFYCAFAKAQTTKDTIPRVKRHVPISYMAKDSVNLALNDIFDRIEDSCSLIIRYAHLNKKTHKFFGKFKDVSVEDTSLVLTEGNYNNEGQKDGYFIAHNLNGDLKAKGSFKNDQYDGKWEVYYDDGKPKLFFEANGNDIKITDAWDAKGTKTVDNGKGTYRIGLGKIYWEGKLLNGKPDGTWSVIKTNDVTHSDFGTEKYKDGVFQKGSGPVGSYTDASRMVLMDPNMLPFTHAEKLAVGRPCNSVKRKHIVRAQYPNGRAAFFQQFKDLLRPSFSRIDIRDIETKIVITGEIADNGVLNGLNSDSPAQNAARTLISGLMRLPAFLPATVDGKPAKEKFRIDFDIQKNGLYRYSLHFLTVEDN